MTKEVVRHSITMPEELHTFASFKYPIVPRRIAGSHIPFEAQDALANSVDLKVKPAMHDFRITQEMTAEQQHELQDEALGQILELKAHLQELDLPHKTLEARLNYVKRLLDSKRADDHVVRFAYKTSTKIAKNFLMGPRDRELTPLEEGMVANCGYYASWATLQTQKEEIFSGRNPFEPILGMHYLGIQEFHFTRSHGKEKIATVLTPVPQDAKPLRVAA